MGAIQKRAILLQLIVLVSAGCSEEADSDGIIATSNAMSILLDNVTETEIASGQISLLKPVGEAEGDPYAEFANQIQSALYIRPTLAYVRIHATSKGIAGLENAFSTLELFLSNTTTTVPMGLLSSPMGTSVQMEVTATDDEIAPLLSSLRSADFNIGIRGATASSTTSSQATPSIDLRLSIDITFTAKEVPTSLDSEETTTP